MKKFYLSCAFLLFTMYHLMAQTQINSTQYASILSDVYKNYDSIASLSFDVQFHYGSDTLKGKFESEDVSGTFSFNGKKAKYTIGDVEFIQNDSFQIAIYNQDRMILVDEPKTVNGGSQLPMRDVLDSMASVFSSSFNIFQDDISNDSAYLLFVKTDSLAPYDSLRIIYQKSTMLLQQISYSFSELESSDTTGGLPQTDTLRKKTFTMSFSNYGFRNEYDSDYETNNTIYFDNNGVCKPVARYKGYKVLFAKPSREIIVDETDTNN